MEDARMTAFQSREYFRASVMHSDLDLAFDLQLKEALEASAAQAGVRYEAPRVQQRELGGDRSVALREQSGELLRREQELIDRENAMKTGERSVFEMRQRWHDKLLAKSIAEMPVEEWEDRGDEFEKPFVVEGGDDGESDVRQVCSLFFARVRDDSGNMATAWAVTDSMGHCFFQQSKCVEPGISTVEADYTALINGLAYARSAGVRHIAAHGDSPVVSCQVSGQWRTRTATQTKCLEQVQKLVKLLDSFSLDVLPRSKNKFCLSLARQALLVPKNGSHGEVPLGVPSERLRPGPSEDCPICFESIRVADMFLARRCAHKFCLSCLTQHVETQVKANHVPVRCPQNCDNHLDLDQCQRYLSPKVLEAFSKRLTEASVPESERVYCPFPNCSALMSKSGLNFSATASSASTSSSTHPHATSIGRTECMECHRLFCVECQVPWHASLSCAQYKKLPPDLRDKEDAQLYQLANNKNWQRCKKCRSMIELDHGCYHMTCRCGHEFCYTCGAEWKNKQATCKCKLWDEDNLVHDDDDYDDEGDLSDDDESFYYETDSEPDEIGENRLFYKTRICRHWQNGYCWRNNCNFAHGPGELRRQFGVH